MIIDFCVEHGAMLACGVSVVLAFGFTATIVQRSPIARLRTGEATIACMLLWLLAACIPLPRFSALQTPSRAQSETRHPAHSSAEVAAVLHYGGDATADTPLPVERLAVQDEFDEPTVSRMAPTAQRKHTPAVPVSRLDARPSAAVSTASTAQVAAVVYLVGSVGCCLWLLVGHVLVWQITAGARLLVSDDPLLSGVDLTGAPTPRFLQSRQCGQPFSFGLFRPTVVLPDGSESPAELRQAVRHELAHVHQRDAAGRFLFNVAFPLVWFHPLYWWLRGKVSFDAELVADDIAARSSSRQTYAAALIALARRAGRRESLVLGVSGAVRSRSQFYQRMERLMNRTGRLSTRCSAGRRSLLAIMFALLLAITSGVFGVPQTAAESVESLTSGGGGTLPRRGIESPWYLNNVLSTSPDTPAFAHLVSLDQTIEVRGTVYDADGSPASGAEVWAASMFVKPPHRERVLADSNGRFLLHLKPFTAKHDRWTVRAFRGSQGGDAQDNMEWLKAAAPEQPAPMVIRMSERGVVRGRLFASESGAAVRNGRLYLGDGRIIESDRSGEYSIDGLKQGNQRMVVVAPGRARKRVIFDTTLRPAAVLDVRLEIGRRIRGRVVDELDQPVPFAYLQVPGSGRAQALDGLSALADEKGEFIWDGVRIDSTIRAMNAGAPGHSTVQHERITSMASDDEPLVFRVKSNGRHRPQTTARRSASESPRQPHRLRDLVGIVRGPDQRPVSAAIVRWGATQYEDVQREVRAESGGRFVLTQVPDREAYVTVIADGLAPQFVHVKQGEREITVDLKEGHTVAGVVVSRSGKPLAGVAVYTVIPSPDPSLCNPYWIEERRTRTDDGGRFKLSALPSLVRFDFLRSDLTEIRNRVLKLDSIDNEIQLDSSGAIRGRVVDGHGRPVRDFRILIGFSRRRHQHDVQSGYSAVYSSLGTSFTDESGEFVFSDLGAGAVFRVRATADGFGDAVVDRVVAVPVSDLPAADELVLRLGPPNALNVRVLDARNGQAIQDAKVTLINKNPQTDSHFRWNKDEIGWPGIRTDENGWAKFDSVSNFEATVAIRHPDFAHHRFGWRKRERQFIVRLSPACVVEGIVESEPGEPLAGVFVNVRSIDQQHDYDEIKASDNGRFRVAELPAGRYHFTLRAQRRTFLSRAIELKTAETKRIVIKVDTAAGQAILYEQRSVGASDESITTSVNGEQVGDRPLETILAEFRDTWADADDKTLLEQLEEAGFRRAIRDAIARQTRQFVQAERPNPKYERYFRESCVPIYERIADEAVWPLGARIDYFRGSIHVHVTAAGDQFMGFSLSLARE